MRMQIALWGCDPELLRDVASIRALASRTLSTWSFAAADCQDSSGERSLAASAFNSDGWVHVQTMPPLQLALVHMCGPGEDVLTSALDYLDSILDSKEHRFDLYH